jgi:hypothetical protein
MTVDINGVELNVGDCVRFVGRPNRDDGDGYGIIISLSTMYRNGTPGCLVKYIDSLTYEAKTPANYLLKISEDEYVLRKLEQ